jgi:hypothetical protein
LEFSSKDGMQVDLKSDCFTPESRPNKDYTRESLNSNSLKCTSKLSNFCGFSFLNSWKTINAFTIIISIEWKNETFHQ